MWGRDVCRINLHVLCSFAIVFADGSGARTTLSFENLSEGPFRTMLTVEVATATT